MNLVELIGRLTRDPEIKYSQGEGKMAIANFTLAVDRNSKKKEGQPTADFIGCKAFGRVAENIEKYTRQGMKIAIRGRIQTGSYTDKNSNKVYTTDVIVDELEFCERKNTGNDSTPRPTPSNAGSDGFMNSIEDAVDTDLPWN